MGDDLEDKRQRLLAKQEQLVQRRNYEKQMQLADDFAYSNGHMTSAVLELAVVEKQLGEVDAAIRKRKL